MIALSTSVLPSPAKGATLPLVAPATGEFSETLAGLSVQPAPTASPAPEGMAQCQVVVPKIGRPGPKAVLPQPDPKTDLQTPAIGSAVVAESVPGAKGQKIAADGKDLPADAGADDAAGEDDGAGDTIPDEVRADAIWLPSALQPVPPAVARPIAVPKFDPPATAVEGGAKVGAASSAVVPTTPDISVVDERAAKRAVPMMPAGTASAPIAPEPAAIKTAAPSVPQGVPVADGLDPRIKTAVAPAATPIKAVIEGSQPVRMAPLTDAPDILVVDERERVPRPVGIVPPKHPVAGGESAAATLPVGVDRTLGAPDILVVDDGTGKPATPVVGGDADTTGATRAAKIKTIPAISVIDTAGPAAPVQAAPTIGAPDILVASGTEPAASNRTTTPLPGIAGATPGVSGASPSPDISVAGTAPTVPGTKDRPDISVADTGTAPPRPRLISVDTTPPATTGSQATGSQAPDRVAASAGAAISGTAPQPQVAGSAQIPSQTPAPAQPAGQVFAAAIAAAVRQTRRDDRETVDSRAPLGIATTTFDALQANAVAATADVKQAALDLRQDSGVQGMIDHIEMLRDGADANDTRIRLIPDALGAVDVSVRKDGDRVHVHFAAENRASAQLLSDAQPRLAELAEARGVKLGQTSVETGVGTGGQSQSGQARQQRHDAPRPIRPAAASSAAGSPSTDSRIA